MNIKHYSHLERSHKQPISLEVKQGMSMLLWILMCSTVMALSEPNDETITNRRNRCRTSSTPLYRRNRRRTSSTSLCDIQSLHTSRLQIDAAVIADAELIANRHPTSATLLCDFTISLLIAIHYCQSTHASRRIAADCDLSLLIVIYFFQCIFYCAVADCESP